MKFKGFIIVISVLVLLCFAVILILTNKKIEVWEILFGICASLIASISVFLVDRLIENKQSRKQYSIILSDFRKGNERLHDAIEQVYENITGNFPISDYHKMIITIFDDNSFDDLESDDGLKYRYEIIFDVNYHVLNQLDILMELSKNKANNSYHLDNWGKYYQMIRLMNYFERLHASDNYNMMGKLLIKIVDLSDEMCNIKQKM